jgi:CHASE3 domain sensor protein
MKNLYRKIAAGFGIVMVLILIWLWASRVTYFDGGMVTGT